MRTVGVSPRQGYCCRQSVSRTCEKMEQKQLESVAKPLCSPPGLRKCNCVFLTDELCYCLLANDLYKPSHTVFLPIFTYPLPANSPKHIRAYRNKVQIFTERRGLIRGESLSSILRSSRQFCCRVPAHRMKTGCVNFRQHAHKSLP